MVLPTLPLAAYIRVSNSGNKGDELRSPEFQQEAIKRSAKVKGIRIDWSFKHDIDQSGAKKERETLDSIIEKIEAGELGGIYVAKLDRLSRMTPKNRAELLERIEGAGGVVLSAMEDIDPSTSTGRFMRDQFFGMARLQWEQFAEGWDTAQKSVIDGGAPMVRAPIGYKRQGKRKPLKIDPKTGPVVRKVFEMRASGKGFEEIGQYLQSKGVLTSLGNETWPTQSIRKIIANRTYLGELHFGKHEHIGAHDPLVDLITWTAAQKPNGSGLAPIQTGNYLLSGLLRCEGCRYCLSGNANRGKRNYRCNQPKCPNRYKRYDADTIERLITDPLPVLSTDAFFADGKQPQQVDTTELEDAYELAKSLLEQIKSPEAQLAMGNDYLHVFKERKDAVQVALERLSEAQQENSVEEPVDVNWTRAEFRAALGRVIDTISIGEGKLVIYPRGMGPKDLPGRGLKNTERKGFSKEPEGMKVIRF